MNEFSKIGMIGKYKINFLPKQKRVLICLGNWILATKNRNGEISRVDFSSPFSDWINAIEILKRINPTNGIIFHDRYLLEKFFPDKKTAN